MTGSTVAPRFGFLEHLVVDLATMLALEPSCLADTDRSAAIAAGVGGKIVGDLFPCIFSQAGVFAEVVG